MGRAARLSPAVLAVAVAAAVGSGRPSAADDRAAPGAAGRALAYLAREVPAWSRANGCYSCHNNGDAARALYDARSRALAVPADALADTTRWLARPEGWDRNGGDGPFSDKRLARVQFASALAAAVASGAVADRGPLARAADRLAADQGADGSWPIVDGNAIGSPASYGRPLATLSARDTLRAADPARFRAAIDRAEAWLLARPVTTVLDASVALLTVGARPGAGPAVLRARALERLGAGQSADGGWGPYASAPPEPFDTALALLALSRLAPTAATRALVRRGRAYLVSTQSPDGGWPETTRPAGAESYAQRLSTTGWAALALLATGDGEPPTAPGPTAPPGRP